MLVGLFLSPISLEYHLLHFQALPAEEWESLVHLSLVLFPEYRVAENEVDLNFFICRFGSGTGQIWLDNVGCTGSESRLNFCTNNGIGSHNCFHSEDVAIYCSSVRVSSTFTSPPTLTPTSSSGAGKQHNLMY